MSAAKNTQRGITFFELLLFIVIVAVGLLGSVAVFGPAVRGSADPMLRKQVLSVAEATLQEVMQKSFQNDPGDAANTSATLGCTPNSATAPVCTANSQAARPNYNDVDDYNGFNQLGVMQIDGVTPVAGLASYQVGITVAPGTLGGVSGAANIKQITVVVTSGRETITLTGFRTNYGG